MTSASAAARPLLRLAVSAVLAVLCVGALATSGSAHARLVDTTPKDGATLAAMPAALVLTFSDPLDEQFVRLRITGPGGQVGTPAFTVDQGTVTVTVPAMGPGAYVLDYRVVSKDGHPVSGRTTFTAQAAATDGPEPSGTFVAVSPTDVPPATDTPSATTSGNPSSGSTASGSTASGSPTSADPAPARTDDGGPGLPVVLGAIVAGVLVLGAGAWFAVGRRGR